MCKQTAFNILVTFWTNLSTRPRNIVEKNGFIPKIVKTEKKNVIFILFSFFVCFVLNARKNHRVRFFFLWRQT